MTQSNPSVPPHDASEDTIGLDDPWVDLCGLDQVTAGEGFYVTHEGHRLAVMRTEGGQIHVIDDTCPHAGGSLAGGFVDTIDGAQCVVCPWHGWPFELDSGRCPDNPQMRVGRYPSRVVNGRVEARLKTNG